MTPDVAGSNLTFTVDDGAGHTGSTTIATINPAPSPYETWAVGGVAFDADTNGDGVKNGMAWLLGALNPSENALDKLPQASRNGTNLRLTFRCLKSTKRGSAVSKCNPAATSAHPIRGPATRPRCPMRTAPSTAWFSTPRMTATSST